MIKWLLSFFKSESPEEKGARLQNEIEEINGKIRRAKNGISFDNTEALEKKKNSLLKQWNELSLPKAGEAR